MPGDAGQVAPEIADGRRRKGEHRRRQLLAATVALIGRGGVAAVTQRAVAAEAGVPPSAVLYYYPTVDGLLVATLTAVNDRYLAALAALPLQRAAALSELAELIAAAGDRDRAIAEYELWLIALRRPELRAELDRWTAALDALTARLVRDVGARDGFAAAVDGLFLRAAAGADWTPARIAGVLARLAGA